MPSPAFPTPRDSPTTPIWYGTSRRRRRLLTFGTLGTAATLLLASCGDQGDDNAALPEETTVGLSVVASIDVYADLAARIVGDTAQVQAIVDNPAVDPHSYEASPQDRLSIEQADVLIANGGGYDPFLISLAKSAERDDALIQVLTEPEEETGHEDGETDHEAEDKGGNEPAEEADDHAEDLHDNGDDDENEHAWYDLALMSDFVTDLAEHLGEASPENAELYTDSAETLAGEIDALNERNRSLDAAGVTFMTTEPVSTYLLADAGFENETDEDFLAAIEHGDDLAPRLLQDALATAENVDVLIYNEQTETNQSIQIREAAEEAGVPVVEFSETLPEDAEGYLGWMDANIGHLEDLLASR